MLFVRRFVGVLACVLVFQTLAFAQGTADIVGRVTDTSGGVMPGVTVTATAVATSISRTTVTGATGDYLFTLLPIGGYTVKIELEGFRTESANVTLATGDRARLDVKLEVGSLSESLTVTGEAPLLQTDTSRLASSFSEKLVQDAPIPGRNIINLVQLSPGASEGFANHQISGNRPDDRRATSAVSINGQGEGKNLQLVDGMDNTERVMGGMGIKPSIDAIAEVVISTNLYAAENGRTMGGVINIITKSGTNQFHGSGFEFARNEHFDSKNFFSTKVPKDREHQFGGSIGGPIRTNRTFFFVDYDQHRINKGNPSIINVPTALMHEGNFSENPTPIYDPLTTPRVAFPGNIIPRDRWNAQATELMTLFPMPTSPGLNNNFAYEGANSQIGHAVDVRLDHRFSDATSIFARYSYNHVYTVTASQCPLAQIRGRTIDPICNNLGNNGLYSGTALGLATQVLGSWVRILSPTLIMEVKGNYVRPDNANKRPAANDKDLATFLGFKNINTPGDPLTDGMPWFEFRPFTYGSLGDPTWTPMEDENHIYQVAGSILKTAGAHNIKIGSGIVWRHFAVQQSQSPRGSFAFDASTTNNGSGSGGNTIASFLLGYPVAIQRLHNYTHPRNRQTEPSIYLQDDWRATAWLTLNLGLRYNVYTPITEVDNLMSNFLVDRGKLIPVGTDGTTRSGNVKTDWGDIEPRFGFSATMPYQMVVRGGWGRVFMPGMSGSPLKNPPFTKSTGPFTSAASSGRPPDLFLSEPLLPLAISSPADPWGSVSGFDPNMKNNRAAQFNVILEKEIGNAVASIGYVGMRIDNIAEGTAINVPTPGPGSIQPRRPYYSLYPNMVGLSITRNTGKQTYNAMQATFTRRFGGGLSMVTHYTYGHNRAFTRVPWDPTQGEWGNNAGYDVRHNYVLTLTYELPWGKDLTGAAHGFLAGWQTNVVAYYKTGYAMTVTNSSSRMNQGASDRPNLIGDPNLPRSQRTVQQYFNTSAFQLEPIYTPGNSPIGLLHAPSQRRIDMSVFKDLRMAGNKMIQLRAEVYNLTNIANFQPPDTAFGGVSFGTISSTGNQPARQMQFGIKFLF
jgi:hypothetical protein